MKVEKTDRGFEVIEFKDEHGEDCTIQQSSAIGDYDHSWNCPGSSFLWIGKGGMRMHVNKEQVAEIIAHLQAWLDTMSLKLPE